MHPAHSVGGCVTKRQTTPFISLPASRGEGGVRETKSSPRTRERGGVGGELIATLTNLRLQIRPHPGKPRRGGLTLSSQRSASFTASSEQTWAVALDIALLDPKGAEADPELVDARKSTMSVVAAIGLFGDGGHPGEQRQSAELALAPQPSEVLWPTVALRDAAQGMRLTSRKTT
jgi:hypothetical protein